MRLLITIVIVSLAVACSARPAEEDYAEYEDAAAEAAPAPSTKAPGRHSLANSRTARGPSPLIGSRGVKTTTVPPKPVPVEPEVVNEPEALEEEGEGDEGLAPATTTEAPKKGVRGGVRPFRSNQDLIAALKRKRQQEHTSGGVSTHPTTATTPAPAETKPSKGSSRSNSNNNSSSGRRTFNRAGKATPAPEVAVEEPEAAKKPSFPSSRRFSGGRGKPAAPAPVSEDPEGEEEDGAPKAAKAFRGGRRL